MKTGTTTSINVDTMVGDETRLTLDADSLSHIVSILTEMYEDPTLAIIREYSTNAADSHAQAGVDMPVRVDLPSRFNPNLIITDQGLGISRDDLEKVYTQYGASTKRDTNDQVGCLGIGCKSALASSDQFTVTSVKDGFRTIAIITRTDDGGATMKIVSHAKVPEPNGVKIEVPVNMSQAKDFEQKARAFFRYWPHESVLVDSVPPDCFLNDPTIITLGENVYLEHIGEKPYSYGREDEPSDRDDIVVMGNIPYPVKRNEFKTGNDGHLAINDEYRLVVYAEIGDVDIAPSRESLRLTPRTKTALRGYGSRLNRLCTNVVQQRVDACMAKEEVMDTIDASEAFLHENVRGKLGTLTWRGIPIPQNTTIPENGQGIVGTVVTRHYAHKDGSVYKYSYHGKPAQGSWKELKMSYIITEFPNTTFSTANARKVMAYHKNRGTDWHNTVDMGYGKMVCFILIPDKWSWEWAPSDRVVTWEEVKTWKDPDKVTSTYKDPTSLRGKLPYITKDTRIDRYYGCELERTELSDLTGTEYYYTENTGGMLLANKEAFFRQRKRDLMETDMSDGARVLIVPTTREAKLLKTYPNLKNLRTAKKDASKNWWKGLTKNQRKLAWAQYREAEALPPIVRNTDSALVTEAAAVLGAQDPTPNTIQRQYLNGLDASDASAYSFSPMLDRYPLMREFAHECGGTAVNHLRIYINAAHAADKE